MKQIYTEGAPKAVGPYSQAIQVGDFLFASGQIGVDPATGEIGKDLQTQARLVMENISHILEAAGAGIENVVKTTCFLDDIKDFAEFNAIYAEYFTHKPARSCVAVEALPLGVLCEVEVIAYLK
ncbi:MAG: RidA family protein [Faecalimonas sp.]|nr:RidA family protein [Faecalimonas sp.]